MRTGAAVALRISTRLTSPWGQKPVMFKMSRIFPPIIGDGDVHRAVEVAQKAFFTPPLDIHLGVSKYDRRSHR
jgi:hypothetical protein